MQPNKHGKGARLPLSFSASQTPSERSEQPSRSVAVACVAAGCAGELVAKPRSFTALLLLLLLLLDRHMILPHLSPQFWTLRPSLDAAISADLGGPVVNAGRRHPSVSFPPIATRREPSEWRIGFPWGSLGR